MIDTREELLNALTEAAELEHSLACQYLFAAFSLKQDTDDGVTEPQQERLLSWKEDLLHVARQEMSHLATASNLLIVIGGAPHFRRANFPQEKSGYYPPDIPFKLERFSVAALERFIDFERPETVGAIAPDPLVYKRVGDLYRQIREGFETIDEQVLFLRADAMQDTQPWGLDVEPLKVTGRASALAAVDQIIREGEATTTPGEESHYRIFSRIKKELEALTQQFPGFDPARPVAENPLTRRHRDSPGKNVIQDDSAREVAELFNALYGSMILLLVRHFAFGGESADQHMTLRRQAVVMMKAVIRPLGEVLTALPMGAGFPGQTAGPGFEFYGDLRLPPDMKTSWALVYERLVAEAAEAKRLAQKAGAPPRLAGVAQSVQNVANKIKAVMPA
jgi:hypothetical protein